MRKRFPWLPWYVTLILTAILLRAGLWFVYSPIRTSDTGGYIRTGQMLVHLDFTHNSGTRTPGFPLLLAMGGFDDRTVWFLHIVLGVFITSLLFFLAWRLLHNAAIAFSVSLIYSLNLAQLFFEATILAETLSTFLFLLTLVIALSMPAEGRRNWIPAALLGLTSGLLVLTRPMFLFIIPIYLLYLWWQARGRKTVIQIRHLAAYLLPSLFCILGWSTVNYVTAGYFGPTSMTGYYIMNHTGSFIEYAPDRYATIREIYLERRAEQIAREGSQTMTIWRSYFDLLGATGLSDPELSKVLTQMSVELILGHPDLYLASVSESWLVFWKVSNFWQLDNNAPPALLPILQAIWGVERVLLAGMNLLFLLFGLYWFWKAIRKRLPGDQTHLLLIWGIVLCASVFQALLERGDNARYAVSFESIIVYAVFAGTYFVLRQEEIGNLFLSRIRSGRNRIAKN